MKKLFFILLIANSILAQEKNTNTTEVSKTLDNWHLAAANADFETYFGFLTQDAIFIGTDATEYWNKSQFETFAKPYFDKGKAWNFKALERHVYFAADGKTAWFDELLTTQMKICRGSGVVIKIKNKWMIQHYVLSMTIPNDNVSEIVKIKSTLENPIIDRLSKK